MRRRPVPLALLCKDTALILIMAALAGCGLVYQYLLAHYAGRVLGVMEHAVFGMIGVMIVSMGIGAFAARKIRCAFTGFAWLEAGVALWGATGVLAIGAAFAFAALFPQAAALHFNLPPDVLPVGGVALWPEKTAKAMPFVVGFVIGALVGMEIPLIARVREQVYGRRLEHNVGAIYGADYIGAGVGAAIFVAYLLAVPPARASAMAAAVNVASGLAFLILFFRQVRGAAWLLLLYLACLPALIALFLHAEGWSGAMEDMLYRDKPVFSEETPYQHITVTRRRGDPPVYSLFLNGRTQFSSADERIYHDMLVHPAMLASNRSKNVLIVGGGDGLAARNVLAWNPERVTLLELDPAMIRLFSEPLIRANGFSNAPLLELNKHALTDPRLRIVYGDAFNRVDDLIEKGERYDAIIVDLPDPSHPDLDKLYSVPFYEKLRRMLQGDGAMAVQSTSPYHAKEAFLTVGVTMKRAGFRFVERYRQNVPSFGEWGWTIATTAGAPPSVRIARVDAPLPSGSWATKEMIRGAFAFPNGFFDGEDALKPNFPGTHGMYLLHRKAWMEEAAE